MQLANRWRAVVSAKPEQLRPAVVAYLRFAQSEPAVREAVRVWVSAAQLAGVVVPDRLHGKPTLDWLRALPAEVQRGHAVMLVEQLVTLSGPPYSLAEWLTMLAEIDDPIRFRHDDVGAACTHFGTAYLRPIHDAVLPLLHTHLRSPRLAMASDPSAAAALQRRWNQLIASDVSTVGPNLAAYLRFIDTSVNLQAVREVLTTGGQALDDAMSRAFQYRGETPAFHTDHEAAVYGLRLLREILAHRHPACTAEQGPLLGFSVIADWPLHHDRDFDNNAPRYVLTTYGEALNTYLLEGLEGLHAAADHGQWGAPSSVDSVAGRDPAPSPPPVPARTPSGDLVAALVYLCATPGQRPAPEHFSERMVSDLKTSQVDLVLDLQVGEVSSPSKRFGMECHLLRATTAAYAIKKLLDQPVAALESLGVGYRGTNDADSLKSAYNKLDVVRLRLRAVTKRSWIALQKPVALRQYRWNPPPEVSYAVIFPPQGLDDPSQ